MKISVLFFGATAEIVGQKGIDVHLNGRDNVNSVVARVFHDHPAIQNHKLLFALNQNYVKGDEAIVEGDELAIFTAVSGG